MLIQSPGLSMSTPHSEGAQVFLDVTFRADTPLRAVEVPVVLTRLLELAAPESRRSCPFDPRGWKGGLAETSQKSPGMFPLFF